MHISGNRSEGGEARGSERKRGREEEEEEEVLLTAYDKWGIGHKNGVEKRRKARHVRPQAHPQ